MLELGANRGLKTAETGQTAVNSARSGQLSVEGGYATQVAALSPNSGLSSASGALDTALQQIAAGQTVEAREALHSLANNARGSGDTATADLAGTVWQLASRLERSREALTDKNYAEAKSAAGGAAELARTLQARGLAAGACRTIIETAGGFWTAADKAHKELSESGAPIVDQHRLNHERNWAFCGIATMLMVLRKNGQNPPAGTRAEVQRLAQGIYHTGSGTSGAGMAERLRGYGLSNAQYTTGGTLSNIVATLQSGQPVPLGVLHSEGTVVSLGSGGSARYPHLKPGASHYKKFGASGHWLAVVGFEGAPEKPKAFFINDPDAGARLRTTPAQLQSMAAANASGGGMWMVHQSGR
jgi:hypothetical protein